MGKNGGGKPADIILTLEEALMRFKRRQGEVGARAVGESESASEVHHVDFSDAAEPQSEGRATSYLSAADSASVLAHHDEASAGMPASEEIVAVIDGIPRTLDELERLAAAEQAYEQDLPAAAPTSVELADEDDDAELGDAEVIALANRRGMMRDYAFTAMGAALMVLVAFLMTRVPIVNYDHANLMARGVATPALRASSIETAANDLISTLVIVPETDVQEVSARPMLKSDELEARIKDTLKLRAFTDIGVSVSKQGDAYLAGEVYSLDEARKIAHIVYHVNGVNRVHFLHPEVLPADRPAFFGVTTALAPAVWGAKVQGVLIGSPADKAGLKAGDVISEFDGKTIPDAKAFNDLLAQYNPGQRVQFRVWHDGQPEYLVARLGEVTTVASR
ncbi:PDZ domain-containing protein [Candidatus Binatus sp.]|uniref:BON domain-containing protein n=1 Tax=Candidatus Binatus sp. TaxID=2811406 RepID=UPI003C717602